MVNRNNTITVECLLAMLKDGRITPDMPLAIWDNAEGMVRGVHAVEIHTYKDGTKVLSFFMASSPVADIKDCTTAAEVFP